MKRIAIRLMTALALGLAACTPGSAEKGAGQATPAASHHPESGLAVVSLSVINGSKRHSFRVEVARTAAEQSRGLMFRNHMGPDEGMIFPMDPPRMTAFWMKNTVIPLDILFIGTDGRISNIAAQAEPYSERPLPSIGAVKGVLEINGGRAAELGIVPGDRVEW